MGEGREPVDRLVGIRDRHDLGDGLVDRHHRFEPELGVPLGQRANARQVRINKVGHVLPLVLDRLREIGQGTVRGGGPLDDVSRLGLVRLRLMVHGPSVTEPQVAGSGRSVRALTACVVGVVLIDGGMLRALRDASVAAGRG